MTRFSKLFMLLLTSFLALSSSRIEKALARRHHRKHHSKVQFKPTIPTLPFTHVPCIFPARHNVTWDFNIKGWPHGKTFKAGDILVFNYDKNLHNVVPVMEEDYSSCSVPALPTLFASGRDEIILRRGVNYFICGTMGHCIAGMLIAVTAT